MHRKFILALLVALSACDEPPPEIVPAAGSFALPGACGAVVVAANGDIFTWSKSSSTSFKIDRRTFDGTPIWSTSLQGATDCSGLSTTDANVVAGSVDSIFVLNAVNGSVRWRRAAASPRIATGTDGKLYVATAPNFGVPSLTSYDGTSGNQLWKQNVTDQGAPYLDESAQTLYFVRRAGARAVNPVTGAIKWETGSTSTDRSEGAAIASDRTLTINRDNASFSAIAAISPQGTELWVNNISTPKNLISEPVIDDSATIYSASCGVINTGCSVFAMSVASGQVSWRKDFQRIESDLVVDAKQNLYVIARLTDAVPYQLYTLHKGQTVTFQLVEGISANSMHPLTLSYNKLLYYIGTDIIFFTPTAGPAGAAAWPMAKHDPYRSARRLDFFLPD